MTALKTISELANTAVAYFHGPVDHTTPQQPTNSLYDKCGRLGCGETNVKRGTNCRACGFYRPMTK